ncbi:MAG: hypothetical protein GY822_17895, partial [Deltaproteobacteria bacterium]|nr:hypothetical protein [Deltaproteobacteria bacterium]
DFDEYWDFHVEQERIRVHGVELENGPVLRLIDGGDSPSSQKSCTQPHEEHCIRR